MAVTTTIERSGQAIRAVLADLSPEEARSSSSSTEPLRRAAESLDLMEADAVLTRWWGIATNRANPPSNEERQLIRRMRAGEDVGWSSPAAWLEATPTTLP
jgi:hypothetical protein